MSQATYVMQMTEKSCCKYCNKMVEILIAKNPNRLTPIFYICFDCRKVFEIGHGEVGRE